EKRVFLVILFTSFSGSLVSRISGAVQIASMDTFLRIAKKAGYQVIAPAPEEIGDINSNTNS
ncbi:hypothetical protein, partial [Escherichia coli]|uniref:hypothetical protein n=1 Tax=Escherichia coli TaxID=562 RepID=UPI001AEC6F37